MKIGDLAMVSEAYAFPSDYGRIKGLVTQILDAHDTGLRLSRVEVMLTSTGRRVSFLAEELEVFSENR